ncbi:formate/nitrite transporter family protein [Limisalsivibrio acetivorans]|uniref:formate/nitrite transporter family protein n=1 Tax=Limisalsivibrio acetivorans TaxID=1304888 RepID=UPI0003B395DB|nr:formate/nitrite transporter family protein [Limisalsivibrio acetivorans]
MKNFLTPAETIAAIADAGVGKSRLDVGRMIVLGLLAGAYIGFAAHLATTVATGDVSWFGFKKFMVGAVFSFGLMLVIIPGSELWTGNNLMVVPLIQGRIGALSMLRNWVFVYGANFFGSVFLAFMIARYSGLLNGEVGATAIRIAHAKMTAGGEGHAVEYFFRGVGCNWLVCLAVLIAMSAREVAGKVLGIFFPIMAFVASGFEHCVANMYFLPAGIIAAESDKARLLSGLGAPALESLSWSGMWAANLIPVTLGNLVGGAVLVGMAYCYCYGECKKD